MLILMLVATALSYASPVAGIEAISDGQTFTAHGQYFCLPEVHYDHCLKNTLNLRATTAELEEVRAVSKQELTSARGTISDLEEEIRVAEHQVGTLTLDNSLANNQVHNLKVQRAGLIVGGVALSALSGVLTYQVLTEASR